MRVLELFSKKTGSVGNVCKARGLEVVSLDRDMPADIRSDIMDWDDKTYKPKSFDDIWASLLEPNTVWLRRRESVK